MKVRFLIDEDVRAGIVRSLRSREPSIDILDVKTAGLRGMRDPALLELAAREDRIMISRDRDTMALHFCERLEAGAPAAGLFLVPQEPVAIGAIVDSLLLVWGGVGSGRVAESDRLSTLPINRRTSSFPGESPPSHAP